MGRSRRLSDRGRRDVVRVSFTAWSSVSSTFSHRLSAGASAHLASFGASRNPPFLLGPPAATQASAICFLPGFLFSFFPFRLRLVGYPSQEPTIPAGS